MHIILDRHFSDLDEMLSIVPSWDVDFKLLETGGFDGRLQHTYFNNMLIFHASFNKALNQQGSTPPGYRTFVIPGENCLGFWWRGHQITNNDLLLFPASNELNSVSESDFEVYTISIEINVLELTADRLGIEWLDNQEEVYRLPTSLMQKLRKHVESVSTGDHERLNLESYSLIEELLIATQHSVTRVQKIHNVGRRNQIITEVIEYISECPGCSVLISDLCRITNTSERTLQYAFKHRYGLSPIAFIKRWKLNQVRKELLNIDRHHGTISDIISLYGFSHHGQFSSDYKKLFKEMPKETILHRTT